MCLDLHEKQTDLYNPHKIATSSVERVKTEAILF